MNNEKLLQEIKQLLAGMEDRIAAQVVAKIQQKETTAADAHWEAQDLDALKKQRTAAMRAENRQRKEPQRHAK